MLNADQLKDKVEAFAVSGYFSPFNVSHEEQALKALQQDFDHPIVLGHSLSSKLNSIQRATTAALNASLLSILQDFMKAIRFALDERGLKAPLMVVRGDGALMSVESANDRPVETVHSGPAASAIGGRFLAGKEKALVIDVGGTTTDIAILDNGRVTIREEGATVGPYSTAVRAANIRSIGLGGDSYIGFDVEDRLLIGPSRVLPISHLAHIYPQVKQDLDGLQSRLNKRFTPDHLEYWFLQREPKRPVNNSRAQSVIEMLEDGPKTLPQILEQLEIYHPLQFGGKVLIQDGVIGRSALTPTDLLHLTGEFAPWDIQSAQIAAHWMARIRNHSIEAFIQEVKTFIAERIVSEVVSFISGQKLERRPKYTPISDLGLWLFEESLYGKNPFLGSRISLKMPIVGIGAPAGIFLPHVAELFDTELILPSNYQVANAVGAVAGSIIVSQEAWIISRMKGMHPMGYSVQAGNERRNFGILSEAKAFAEETITGLVLAEAQAAGASEPSVEVIQLLDGAESYRLRASAIGNPLLSD
jgi:N-methylhydantoinase A/oxoprolinase/acetone carboxylase beta subunit